MFCSLSNFCRRTVLYVALISFFYAASSTAQVVEKFHRIGSRETIPQSIIYSIDQDSFGNIWAATEEGAIRYNSKRTFLYNKYRGLVGNTHNRVYRIFIDSKQRIWLGTEDGLSQYVPEKDHFVSIRPRNGQGPVLIKCLAEDGDHNIWIGSFNGLWKYTPGTFQTMEQKFKQFAPEKSIQSLHYDDGILLAGTTNGLFELDAKTEAIRPLPPGNLLNNFVITAIHKNNNQYLFGTRANGLVKTDQNFGNLENMGLPLPKDRTYPVHRILEGPLRDLYVGTDGAGLWHVTSMGKLLGSYSNDPNNPNSIASNGIYDLLLDDEGILWIATYGGGINSLHLSENYFQSVEHILNNRNSLAHNFTRSILEDKEGNIWFGTRKGISIWYRKIGEWKHIPAVGGSAKEPDIIMALAEADNFIWVGTYGRGAFKINKKNFSTQHYHPQSPPPFRMNLSRIYSILIDRSGNCWLGGIEDSLHLIKPEGSITKFPLNQIRHLVQSQDGSILASGRNGVQRIKNGNIIDIEALKSGQHGFDYSYVSCVYEDKNGNLVAGTNGSGLIFLDVKTGVTKVIDPTNGLPSDIVQGILSDDAGNLWVSTTRGLAEISVNARDTLIKLFDKSDGLGSNEFNYGSFAKLSGGYLAFGGVDGVAFFNPANIERQRHLPKIVLDELQLLNRRTSDKDLGSMPNIQTAKSIVLRHDENTFSIRFAGVLHSIPSKVSYSWIMEGLSEGWSVPSEQDFISFTNVPPGKYTFRVKAANRDGAWGPVRVLRVSIAPPWYATNLAYIIYALLAVALMVALGNLVSILIQKRNAEEQIAFFSNITHEIKTPLSILLSTLESSANKQEATSAGSEKLINTIKRMNALFEQLLNFNKVASQKMLPGSILKLDMRSYLDRMVKNFEPMQLENNIKVTIIDEWQKDVFYYDKDALDKILYNLYSNAIKYCRKDGEIRIILNAWSNSGLRLTIQDNGIGIPKEQQKYIMKRYFRSRNAINSQLPGTGLGLMIAKNLAERDKGNITFNSVENQGTSFIVSLRNLNHLYYKSAIISGTAKLTDEVRDKVRTGKYSDAKILVVEDNDELRKIVADELGTHFQVYEADNGKAGLELIAQIYPDIVLTDLVMPKMDGLDLCRAIKADVNMNHIPVLMMTVLNNPEIKLESIEIGVSEFMEKPIDFNILLAKIINILEWQTKLRQHYQQFADQEYSEKYRNRREGEFLLQIESFILEKIQKEDLSVHDMCRHVGMSRTALYNKLVSMVGMSPQNFIIHTRMKYARKLLVEKNLSIKEVAMISGFSNPKYFSTAFKKYYKESPTAFVKKLQSSP